MKSNNYPVSRKKDIVVQDLEGETLIYDLKINKAFCLNETSALIWQLCDGTKSVDEIAQLMSNNLNGSANENLVWLGLDLLDKENLLSEFTKLPPEFKQLSRREVIRKIGLGTTLALPIISSVTAPTAVQAQSTACVNLGDTCTGTIQGNCCPGTFCQDTSGGAVPTQCFICIIMNSACTDTTQCCMGAFDLVCVGGMCV